jgi:outer membrane protein assembly factor BamB
MGHRRFHFMTSNKRLFFFLFVIFAALLSGCAGGTGIAADWPGVSLSEDSTTAYVAYQQHVYAVDVANGDELWRYPQEADNAQTFFAVPALAEDGQLVAGTYNNLLYSLNIQENGQPNNASWTFSGANDRYVAGPLAANGMIFAPNADSLLYGVNLNGEQEWEFDTGEPLWATPVTDGSRVYLPAMDHNIYAIDPETGDALWETGDLGGSVAGTPTLGEDGVLYAGTFAQEMVAINTENGEVIWRAPTDGWVWSGPAIADGVLYFGDLKGVFYALNASDGSEVWKITPEAGPDFAITDQPLVLDGSLYFSSENGSVYVLDSANGNQQARWEVGGKLFASPLLAGETILVAPMQADFFLAAYELDGDRRWVFPPEEN